MAQNDSPDIVIYSGYLNKPVTIDTINQLIRSTDTFNFLLCRYWKLPGKIYSIRRENTLMSPVALGIKLS